MYPSRGVRSLLISSLNQLLCKVLVSGGFSTRRLQYQEASVPGGCSTRRLQHHEASVPGGFSTRGLWYQEALVSGGFSIRRLNRRIKRMTQCFWFLLVLQTYWKSYHQDSSTCVISRLFKRRRLLAIVSVSLHHGCHGALLCKMFFFKSYFSLS